MMNNPEIESIKEQIINKYSPNKIILFGSQTNGTATDKSDIDLCIVKNTENKRALAVDMYMNIESCKPFDIIVYTESEWNQCVSDTTSFAYLVHRKGIEIYG